MENTLSQLFFLVLTVCIISSTSCENEQDPDLVPITPLLLLTIPHGVLYDRVVPWASLDMTVSGDTFSTDLLAQVLA